MLYREIITVCSLIHTKHTNTSKFCGKNVEFVNAFLVEYIVITGLRRFKSQVKNKSVNDVQENNRCCFSDPHKIYTLRGQNVEFVNALRGGP
jgi:hypothetical protein